ncbi:MAG: ABC transporter permease, partial [Planctomycetota bacterium]
LVLQALLLAVFVVTGIVRVRTGRTVVGRVGVGVLLATLLLNSVALVASIDVAGVELARASNDTSEGVATQRGEEFDPELDLRYDLSAVLEQWWRGSHVQNIWVHDLLLLMAAIVLAAARREYWRNAWRQVSGRVLAMICFGIMLCYAGVAVLDSLTWQDAVVNADGTHGTIKEPPPLTDAQIAADVTGNRQRTFNYKKRWVGLPNLEKDRLSLLTRLCAMLKIYRTPDERERTYSAPFATRLYKRLPFSISTGAEEDLAVGLSPAAIDTLREAIGRLREQTTSELLSRDATVVVQHSITLAAVVAGLSRPVRLDLGDATDAASLNAADLRARLLADAAHHTAPGEVAPTPAAAVVLAVLRVDATGRGDYPLLLHPGAHILGTNEAGQDVLYLALRGIRTALVIGCVTTLIAIPFAMLFGILAGYFGGWVDDVITWVYAVLGNIPDILLIAAVILLFGPGLFQLCIVMGLTSWVGLCRLLRGEALRLREMEYVQAARAFGVAQWRILMRHIVPNVMHIVLISFILRFSGLVLAEAVLSYLGIGVGPETGSWGNMINQAIGELAREPVVWWSFASAMLFMLVLVLAANIFGDAVRDALDPRLRTR